MSDRFALGPITATFRADDGDAGAAVMPVPASGSVWSMFLSKMSPSTAAAFASSRCGAESTMAMLKLRRGSAAAVAVSYPGVSWDS